MEWEECEFVCDSIDFDTGPDSKLGYYYIISPDNIDSKNMITELRIIPNPVENFFSIKISNKFIGNYKILIVNNLGKTIKTINGKKENYYEKIKINAENYSNGIYNIKVLLNNNIIGDKSFIIAR